MREGPPEVARAAVALEVERWADPDRLTSETLHDWDEFTPAEREELKELCTRAFAWRLVRELVKVQNRTSEFSNDRVRDLGRMVEV